MLYLLLFLLVFCSTFFVAIYFIFLVYSWLKGSPFVSTNDSKINEILKEIHPKKGAVFIDLGCGDGRVVQQAVRDSQLVGIGIDVNPLLILKARITSFFGNNNIRFKRQNIVDADISNGDIIYIFLFPKLIAKLKKKLLKETKRPVIIISHAFKIDYLGKYLTNTIFDKPFNTYFYKIVN